MFVSLYNYVVTKMRLKSINKTIELFDDDYPVQLLQLEAQRDMIKYEEDHWKQEVKTNTALWFLIISMLIGVVCLYIIIWGWTH